jgi:peptide/nickel transport system ATP-binding protein
MAKEQGKHKWLEVREFSIELRETGRFLVQDLNFEIEQGEFVALVGESGSGKSISAMSLVHLIPKTFKLSGKIFFEGKNLLEWEEKDFRKIRAKKMALIFQNPMHCLNPVYTCGWQIEEVLKENTNLSGTAIRHRCLELLGQVKIKDVERAFSAYPHQLSGGQKQRIMIAMALASNPEMLIADEPTTALDVLVQKEILDLVKEIQKEHNLSVLFITHDLNVGAAYADRILVMKEGELVEQGTAKAIFEEAQHPYTQGLVNCKPNSEKYISPLPTVELFEQTDPTEWEALKASTKKIEFSGIESLIHVEDLRFKYPEAEEEVLKGINFDLYKGETLGLVGASGCGKSTLGNCLMLLGNRAKGTLLFSGENILNYSGSQIKSYRKKVQMIFQDPYGSLNSKQKIGDHLVEIQKVHFPERSKSESVQRAYELLDQVGLQKDIFGAKPGRLSGGQRQRVCIARSLALEPEILIFDESVAALDVSVQARILNLLNELKKNLNLTYIFISHDLAVVHYISDRIMVLNQGRIEELGAASQVYFEPKSDYTRLLLKSGF